MTLRMLTARTSEWLALLWELPWLRLLGYLGRAGHQMLSAWRQTGPYEVLHYESTLALQDARGRWAVFSKRQQIRYLQPNVVAWQDRVWSDGEGPLDYRCAPGVVVDRYRPAQTTILLISPRQSKQRGEVDELSVQWRMRDGFRRRQELWQTTFYEPTHAARISVIFPRRRPPQAVWGSEETTRRRHELPATARRQLPDGRWRVQWSLTRPRHHERYNLHWRW